jgi:hypothetical protein
MRAAFACCNPETRKGSQAKRDCWRVARAEKRNWRTKEGEVNVHRRQQTLQLPDRHSGQQDTQARLFAVYAHALAPALERRPEKTQGTICRAQGIALVAGYEAFYLKLAREVEE